MKRALDFILRCLFTPPVPCMACGEPIFYVRDGFKNVCPMCDAVLRDPSARTTSRPPRSWQVETPKVARIIRRRA